MIISQAAFATTNLHNRVINMRLFKFYRFLFYFYVILIWRQFFILLSQSCCSIHLSDINHTIMHTISKPERQTQIEKLFLNIGSHIRFLLKTVTFAYQQNNINYSVIEFHQKIMRLLAPPYQLLGLDADDDQQKSQELSNEQQRSIQALQSSNNYQTSQLYTTQRQISDGPQMPLISRMVQKDEIHNGNQFMARAQQNKKNKKRKKKIFIGNNPTGIYKTMKENEQNQGQFLRKSLKAIRNSKKYTQNYEQNQGRNQDQNRIPKRRSRKPKQQKMADEESNDRMKRGRRVDQWNMQQRIYGWARDKASSGKPISKIDIRNQYKNFSQAKSNGSTHPEINSWFNRTKIIGTNHLMEPIKTEQIRRGQNFENEWFRPIQDFSDEESNENSEQKQITENQDQLLSEKGANQSKEPFKLQQN